MHIRAGQTDPHSKSLVLARLQQKAEVQRRYVAQLAWWRRSIFGYLLCVPFTGLGLFIVIVEQSLMPHFYFPGAIMLLPVLLIALFWGLGPALLCVLISTLFLDYYYIPPARQFTWGGWDDIVGMLPYFIAGMCVAILVGQREAARRRALFAEQEVQGHAHELEQINQELKEANQLKDRFLSMASHELKTPLTTIRGHAQISLRRLSKQHDLPDELLTVRTSLQKIDEQTSRLNMLLEDLLELSNIRAGKVKLRLRECDLAAICREVVEDQRMLTNRTIELEVPPTPVKLRADPDRLNQVVINLLSNAIKYSPSESAVEVYVSQLERAVTLRVHDSGLGIPKDQLERIFETFYRAPGAQASSKSGWGLGLAICKDIVERHSGRVWCESQPGDGTTFSVELPRKL
ncbi:MAG: ATP-binding protein [Chloroflexota bacterium]|nr:ATP-binding protein [Chloroflexota bacterium]